MTSANTIATLAQPVQPVQPVRPEPGSPTKVLLVHDVLVADDALREALGLALDDEGSEVQPAGCGEEALAAVQREPFDLVLFNLMLPGLDGVTICRRLRAEGDLPIIIITACSAAADVIDGLDAGADDYVTKPVLASVLAARIRALLRRYRTATADTAMAVGDLEIRPDEGVIRRGTGPDAAEIHLTPTEFRLLTELAAARGRVVTREDLLRRVWGYDYLGDTRMLDVHIRRLRCKIEPDPDRPTLVLTVRSVGYKVAPSSVPPAQANAVTRPAARTFLPSP
jgi:two-component system response regulator MtrA